MAARIVFALVFVLGVIAVRPASAGSCGSDSDCGGFGKCSSGQCGSCGSDSDCNGHGKCSSGKCGSCGSDSDCKGGRCSSGRCSNAHAAGGLELLLGGGQDCGDTSIVALSERPVCRMGEPLPFVVATRVGSGRRHR